MVKSSNRGRAYSCANCPKVGEKQKMVHHYYLMHVPLDQVPYYCSFCTFRCTQRKELDRHVKGYRPHVLKVGRQGDPGPSCLRENRRPREIVVGTDIIRLDQTESSQRWSQSRRNSQEPADIQTIISCDIPLDLWDLGIPEYNPTPISVTQQCQATELAQVAEFIPLMQANPEPAAVPEDVSVAPEVSTKAGILDLSIRKRKVEDEVAVVAKRKRTESLCSDEGALVEGAREVRRLQSEISLMKSVTGVQNSADQLMSATVKDRETMESLHKAVTGLSAQMGRIMEEQASQRRLLVGILRRLGDNNSREIGKGHNKRR